MHTMELHPVYVAEVPPMLKNAINHVLAESKYANLVPTGEQWLAAEKLCALLKPYQIATDFLQGEIYPTLGSVSRIITTLVQGLQGAMPPVHWQLRARCSDLPIIVQHEIVHPKGHACALESIRSPSVYGSNNSSRA